MKAERGLLSVGLESPFLPRMLSTVAALSREDAGPGESAALGTAAKGHTYKQQEHSSLCACVAHACWQKALRMQNPSLVLLTGPAH